MYQGMNVNNLSEIQERARTAVASSTPPPSPCMSPGDISIDRRFAVAAESESGFDDNTTAVKDAWRIASVSHAAWVFWTREKGDDKKRALLDRWVDAWEKERNLIIQEASAPASTQGSAAVPSEPMLPADIEATVDADEPTQDTPTSP